MDNRFNSSVPDLSMLYATNKKNELFGHDIVDLLPEERIVIMELMVAANEKFEDLFPSDDLKNDLIRYSLEVDETFAAAGWSVFVDAFNVEETRDGFPYLSPVINITGRIEEAEFDFDKAISDTQHGLMDGIIGKVDERGNWHSPDSLI